MMPLPPLYKYLDVEGAKLTLGNGTFRHAKPSSYKDLEDMTIKSVFPEEIDTAVAKLSNGWTDVILANLDEPSTCSPRLAALITLLQGILREHPEQAEQLKHDYRETFDAETMRARSEAFVKETNEFMQTYRILCVSTDNVSERMWEDYAQDHEGIILRIEPNMAKDSKYALFRPVRYQRSRPALYDETMDFLTGLFFGDKASRAKATLEKIIYAKTLPYRFENEYRLSIPSGADGDWELLPYHPEEITELYLGYAISAADKRDIVALANARNSAIRVLQMRRAGKSLVY
jgi:hypothetical protein